MAAKSYTVDEDEGFVQVCVVTMGRFRQDLAARLDVGINGDTAQGTNQLVVGSEVPMMPIDTSMNTCLHAHSWNGLSKAIQQWQARVYRWLKEKLP